MTTGVRSDWFTVTRSWSLRPWPPWPRLRPSLLRCVHQPVPRVVILPAVGDWEAAGGPGLITASCYCRKWRRRCDMIEMARAPGRIWRRASRCLPRCPARSRRSAIQERSRPGDRARRWRWRPRFSGGRQA